MDRIRFQSKLSRKSKLFACLSVGAMSILTGCDFVDPVGGYSGVWITPQEKTFATAYFEDYKDPKSNKVLNVTLYKTLGTATPHSVHMTRSLSKHSVTLHFSEISPQPVELTLRSIDRHQVCGIGRVTGRGVTLCYGKERVDLNVVDSQNHPVMEIHLRRGADFKVPLQSTLTLDEAMGRARFNDYKVQQESEKVYRAWQKIRETRAGLAPQFSASTITNTALIPLGNLGPYGGLVAFGMVDSFLPFVYPTNWYKRQQAKWDYHAEQASFKALQGNQMLATQLLYYTIHKNSMLITASERRLQQIEAALRTVYQQKAYGVANDEQISVMEEKILNHKRTLTLLKSNYDQEVAAFAQAMEFNPIPEVPLGISRLNLPMPYEQGFAQQSQSFAPLNAASFYQEVQHRSFEMEALRKLQHSAHIHYKDAKYSFIYPGSLIRLDLGYGARAKSAKSLEVESIERIDEMMSILKEKSVEVSSKYNAALKDNADLTNLLEVQKSKLERLQVPGYFKSEIVQERESVKDSIFETELNLISNQHDILATWAAYERLTLTGMYESLRYSK